MSVTQPPKDTPFGLEPNVAAGLAYLFTWVGGLVMLLGGGTNKFVKWSAAQSITMWGLYWLVWIVWTFATMMVHPLLLLSPLLWLWALLFFALWIWTTITGFQGNELRLPVISGLTESIFKTQL
ncbi:MAG TPA: hypothetical protein VKR56_09300 [Candidatus Cybelea sp.]|nr:hypothetical protein [Candidatus Cybelea sp.]